MAGICPSLSPAKLVWNIASLGLLLPILLTPQEVTSFSVGGRARRRTHDVRNLDLAQALALLQRERRRVGAGDFMTSQALALLQRERRRVGAGDFMTSQDLLGSRPLLGKDVDDWVSSARDIMLDDDDLGPYLGVGQEPTWISDGNFKGFAPQTQTVKPTQQEIEDIFSNDEEPAENNEKKKKKKDAENNAGSDKKKKRSSPKVERKLVKKSIPPPPVSLDDQNNLSLDTLTQEEFKALMKAVGKLQRQVAAKGGDGATQGGAEFLEDMGGAEPEQEMAIIQPASKEELQSLFAKEDDNLEDGEPEVEQEDEEEPEVDILPKSRVIMEEEVQTPEGGRRVLEVDTPQGGTRLTELESPDGQQEVMEETLPEGSMGSLQEAIEDSEREISDALASQLERDISQEAINEELEAEEKEAEEEAEEEAAAADDAVSAAEEEIAREIGADDLAELEKMWISKGNDLPPYPPEKRTTKRAARNGVSGRYSAPAFRPQGIPDDLTLERLLSNSDVADDDQDVDEDIIDSINEGVKEAALEREILHERDIKNALNAISSDNSDKEDIIYGNPLTDTEFRAPPDKNFPTDDIVFDISSQDQAPPETSLSIKRSRRVDEERLRQLANALSMNDAAEEDEDEDEDVDDSDSLLSDDDMEPAEENDEVVKVFEDLGLGSGEDGGHLPQEVAGLPPPLGKFVTRIVELQDEVGQLRAIAQLADLENDVLTDALNEATMAQPPGTVSDMEFESLQQAIWVEKELQKLKQGASPGDLNFLSQAGSLSPAATSAGKRGEPWRRKRGKVQIGEDSALQTFPVSSSVRPARPVGKDDIAKLLGETYLNKDPVSDLTDADLDEDGIASIFLPDADECPAVREYSTNCELADLYSLPVDYEARALCNLHEMCYACGHSLHVPQASCDEVYRAAANTLCREGSACVLEAEIFLRTMKLKTRYMPHSQPACRSTCMARFLGML